MRAPQPSHPRAPRPRPGLVLSLGPTETLAAAANSQRPTTLFRFIPPTGPNGQMGNGAAIRGGAPVRRCFCFLTGESRATAPTPHLQKLPGATSSATWWTRGGLVPAPMPPTEKMVAHCPRVPAVPP